jgi:hypothetical protein
MGVNMGVNCTYHSPPGYTLPFVPVRPDTFQCVGPCDCHDLHFDDLMLQLHDPVALYETLLHDLLDKAKAGQPVDPHTLLFDIPDSDDFEKIVEDGYWKSMGFFGSAWYRRLTPPQIVSIASLPPCMHRLYAKIDQIFGEWEEKKIELVRLSGLNDKRALEERHRREKEVSALACRTRPPPCRNGKLGVCLNCTYHSPPGYNLPFVPVPPNTLQCVGPCDCHDLHFDDLMLQLHDPVALYETLLHDLLDKAKAGRSVDDFLDLEIPDSDDFDMIVEDGYWKSIGYVGQAWHLSVFSVASLPPCMHRLYAKIDQIFAEWEEKKIELVRLCALNRKRTLKEHRREKKAFFSSLTDPDEIRRYKRDARMVKHFGGALKRKLKRQARNAAKTNSRRVTL